MPHASLFAGPEGVGKQMLAQRFARLLLCSDPVKVDPPGAAGEPKRRAAWRDACGKCEDCTLLAADSHPDYHPIHRKLNKLHPEPEVRARKSLELGIDVIRHFLIEVIGQRPARGRAKVFVVIDAHLMNLSAQNALLKTLEEPPGASYLILTTSTVERLLPTTRSRCQVVQFGLLPTDFVANKLQAERGLSPNDARYLAGLTEGRLGLAMRYGELQLPARAADVLAATTALPRDPLAFGKALKDQADAMAKAASGAREADDSIETDTLRTAQRTVLAMTACLLRDVLRTAGGAEPVAHAAGAELADLARRYGRLGAARAIRAVAAAEAALDQNANVGLVFDVLGMECHRSLGSPVVAAVV